jgi:uncharacterized glyoxalase superfamily protein PhnB
MAEFELDDFILVLDQVDEAPSRPEVTIAFGTDDADSVFHALRERGVAVEEPPRDQPWGVRNLYLRDPDGYAIEFEQRLA